MIKTGTFASRSGTGAQSIAGLGFQPTGLLIYSSMNAGSYQGFLFMCSGVSDGTTQKATNCAFYDNTVPPGSLFDQWTGTISSVPDGVILTTDARFGGITQHATVAFNVDGFTLTWNTNNFSSLTYGYVAFGPPVVCKVVTPAVPLTTGSQTVTGVGFQPKALIGWYLCPTTLSEAAWSLGVSAGSASSVLDAHVRFATRFDAGDQVRVLDETAFIHRTSVGGSPPTTIARASVTSLNADGFTLNWSTVTGGAESLVVLAIGGTGLAAGVGTFSQRTTGPGPQTVATTGVTPEALVFLSANAPSVASYTRNTSQSVGAMTTGSQYGIWSGSIDQFFDVPNNCYFAQSSRGDITSWAILLATCQANTPFGTTNAAAQVTALTATGYSLNWTIIDTTPRAISWLALGTVGPTLVITPATLPFANNQAPYSQQLVSTGVAPHTFTLTSGTLPPGLTLSPSGLLSGTPTYPMPPLAPAQLVEGYVDEEFPPTFLSVANTTATQTRTFTVGVADSIGAIGTKLYLHTTRIWRGPPVSFAVLPTTPLPGCLRCSAAGQITGIPMRVGSFPITVRVVDQDGVVITADFTLVIEPTGTGPGADSTWMQGSSWIQPGWVQ